MRKKMRSSLVGTALILCTFVGLETLSNKLNKQEPNRQWKRSKTKTPQM